MTNYRIGLENKVVAVTGGYGLLGSSITRSLLAHDAIVVILGRSEEKFQLLKEKSGFEGSLHFVSCDVSNTDSVKSAFANVVDQFGCLDCLINNAAYSVSKIPEEMSDEDWEAGINGSLTSVFKCIRESLQYLTSGGRIINVSSMYGSVSPDFSVYDEFPNFFNPVNYGAGKAGVQQLTRYFANYLGPKGITVNCVSPGPFPSEQVKKSAGFIKQLESRTALKRVGSDDDIGGVFAFLASDQASFITGQNIFVDGGWTTR